MDFKRTTENAKAAALYRKEAKTKNLNGQNVISNVSVSEHSMGGKEVSRMADMYEEYGMDVGEPAKWESEARPTSK